MMNLNKEFWEDKYANNQLRWDIGHISTPLKAYIDQLSNKEQKILVPGAGNGYEVGYLYEQGFSNVFVIDIAEQPLKNIICENPDFPERHLLQMDFFDYEENNFDLILEQTFFCALNPSLRGSYVSKMHDLLHENGNLVGLLFDFPLTKKGPPFGGDIEAYRKLFRQYFKIKILEKAYNSIEPRKGNELFFIFDKVTQ